MTSSTTAKTDPYQYARYYDLTFPRDYATEGEFLAWASDRYNTSGDRSFLELGCGPAGHARQMARRGFRAIGLDLVEEMIVFAREEAAREKVPLETILGDMTDFTLERPVGMIACLLETICVLQTNELMVKHLRAVARNLLPGGIYVFQTAHPRYSLAPYDDDVRTWTEGDTRVEMMWGHPHDVQDPVSQVVRCTRRLVVREGGKVTVNIENHIDQRYHLHQELRALIELSGVFAESHWFGKLALPPLPLSAERACNSMIGVLVKR